MPGNHATTKTGGPSRAGFMANRALERFAALMNTVWTIRIVLTCALVAVLGIPHLMSSPAANVPSPTSLTWFEAEAMDGSRMAADKEAELDRFLRDPRRIVAHPGIYRQLLIDIKASSNQMQRPDMAASELQGTSPCIAEVEQDRIDIEAAAAMEADWPTALSPRASGLSCSSHIPRQLSIEANSFAESIPDGGTSTSPRCGGGTEFPTVHASWETPTAGGAPAHALERAHAGLETSMLKPRAGQDGVWLSPAAPHGGVHRDVRSDHGICFLR